MRKCFILVLLVFFIFFTSSCHSQPSLVGGMKIVCKVNTAETDPAKLNTIAEQTIKVLKKRLKQNGNYGAVVTKETDGLNLKIAVMLPPKKDLNKYQILGLIISVGKLEFKKVVAGPAESKEDVLAEFKGECPEDASVLESGKYSRPRNFYVLKKMPVVTGADIETAKMGKDSFGQAMIAVKLSETGGKRFQAYTAANIDKFLAIVFDDRVISAPIIQGEINRNVVITGQFSRGEIENMVTLLNAGQLPASLTVLEQVIISPDDVKADG